MRRKKAVALVALLAMVLAILLVQLPDESRRVTFISSNYLLRGPIVISGDAGFNSTNGVTSGNGSESNPYVIEGWEINASSVVYAGIAISSTNAYFVLRNLWIHSGGDSTGGIDLWLCRNAMIAENIIEDCAIGIYADNCGSITIANNTVRQNWYGVCSYYSEDVNVTGNRVTSSGRSGLSIVGCENSSAYLNYLHDNDVGIEIGGGHNVTASWNNVTLNSNGIVASNDPKAGLPVTIFHNNFWANGVQAYFNMDYVVWPTGRVYWNSSYPRGGNFWSDFAGEDLFSGPNQNIPGSDGMSDTDYMVPMSWWGEAGYTAASHYPLMSPLAINWAPVASFTVTPVSGDNFTVFRFNASNSSDLENPIGDLTFRWDWDGDGVWDTDWSSNPNAEHIYVAPVTCEVMLEVRDPWGLVNRTGKPITVTETAIPEMPPSLAPLLVGLVTVVMALGRLRNSRTRLRP